MADSSKEQTSSRGATPIEGVENETVTRWIRMTVRPYSNYTMKMPSTSGQEDTIVNTNGLDTFIRFLRALGANGWEPLEFDEKWCEGATDIVEDGFASAKRFYDLITRRTVQFNWGWSQEEDQNMKDEVLQSIWVFNLKSPPSFLELLFAKGLNGIYLMHPSFMYRSPKKFEAVPEDDWHLKQKEEPNKLTRIFWDGVLILQDRLDEQWKPQLTDSCRWIYQCNFPRFMLVSFHPINKRKFEEVLTFKVATTSLTSKGELQLRAADYVLFAIVKCSADGYRDDIRFYDQHCEAMRESHIGDWKSKQRSRSTSQVSTWTLEDGNPIDTMFVLLYRKSTHKTGEPPIRHPGIEYHPDEYPSVPPPSSPFGDSTENLEVQQRM